EGLHGELKENAYQPLPVRQVPIEKRDKPGEYRLLGIPTIYDRVCQQALLNRLEPIFEPLFDDANFGYRRGRSTKDALRKIWKEIDGGREWIVDADLRDFFGSVDHEKLLPQGLLKTGQSGSLQIRTTVKARDIDVDRSPCRLCRHEQCLERRKETTSHRTGKARMVFTKDRARNRCTA